MVLNLFADRMKLYFALCCALGKSVTQEPAFLTILKSKAGYDHSGVLQSFRSRERRAIGIFWN